VAEVGVAADCFLHCPVNDLAAVRLFHVRVPSNSPSLAGRHPDRSAFIVSDGLIHMRLEASGRTRYVFCGDACGFAGFDRDSTRRRDGPVEAFDQGRPGLGPADAYETHVDGIAGVPTQV